MAAEISAGATSHTVEGWHDIDWQAAQSNVRRLQARIVKATQEGRWGKVKALQRLLTHSFSGKALAVKRVTENAGKQTPGVDGETWDSPEKKAAAIQTLRQHGYRPQPLRRLYIPKSNGKKRPLGIPTMKDRAMQALYLLALDPIAETTGDRNSFGFRPGRSAADAIVQCYQALANTTSAEWILEGDIKSCFDKISHEWLLANVCLETPMLRKWLKAGYMQERRWYETEEGTPQGGIISPVLANLVLDGLEERLKKAFPHKRAGQGPQFKINLIRYADDFIITGRSKELLENEVKPLVEEFMGERGLTLSQEKTRITHIEAGFDFLGQNIRTYNGKFLTKPSQKNVKAFLSKIRTIIKENPAIPAGALIKKLNPIIRGWAQYHQHGASSATFRKVDRAIYEALWRWAKRRHPNKGARWIRQKYFRTIGNRSWVFCGETDEQVTATLFYATDVPIRRHRKIKGEANPYDPAWEGYFEERLGVKMARNLRGRRKQLSLWMEQEGICPVCSHKITEITGWHVHHVVPRVYGGSDRIDNLVLLHPNCHRQVHSQKKTVVKPRPAKGERKA
jgi:RNA-directed DNA polymerase